MWVRFVGMKLQWGLLSSHSTFEIDEGPRVQHGNTRRICLEASLSRLVA